MYFYTCYILNYLGEHEVTFLFVTTVFRNVILNCNALFVTLAIRFLKWLVYMNHNVHYKKYTNVIAKLGKNYMNMIYTRTKLCNET